MTSATPVETKAPAVPRGSAASTAERPERGAGARLLSLDAYRGFIMLLLISHGFGVAVLAKYPGYEWLARQVEHVPWDGATFWDLIMPAFTFMVGVAMPFALARRREQGATFWQLFRHVAWRAFFLIVLSNILSNFGAKRPTLQFVNVLTQIGFGYFICFLVTRLRFAWQVAAGVAILGGYWVLFAMFPGPEGAFSKTGNIGSAIDMAVLGYNYPGYYTSINFVANSVTILFGYWAGLLVQRPHGHGYKLKVLFAAAAAGLAGGLLLATVNPMVKRLWTPSFTVYSTGWVILMMAVFYWLIEVRGYRRWAFPMVVIGMNSIFIYAFCQVLRGWLHRGLATFTGNFWFLGDAGAIPQNLVTLGALWYLCYWLYRRKIFIKI